MIRMLGALGLFGLSLTTGCVTEDDASGTYPVDGLDGAMAKSMNPGDTVEVCVGTSATFDTGDSGNVESAVAWCPDDDLDSYIGADPTDPFFTGCLCLVLVEGSIPDGWLNVTATSDITEDCDDEDDTIGFASYTAYTDADSDGYGADGSETLVCDVDGYATVGGDCDDTDATANPLGTEICDDVDNNCDGDVDDADDDLADSLGTWYEDGDADSFGDADDSFTGCDQPEGWVEDDTDCDDGDADISPDAIEVCDDADNDCDGLHNDDDDSLLTLTGSESWPDVDGDGFGDMDAESTWSCAIAEGQVEDDTDCDDADGGANPDASEIADDGIDQDCDGSDLETSSGDDADGDGFDSEASGGTDCDDTDAAVNTDAIEVSFDGIDNDCNGAANTSDLVEVCGDPVDALLAYTWQLWLRPEDEASWDVVAEGTDELCAEVYVEDGVSQYVQGPFDRDGDGTFDEDYVDATTGDGIWLYQDDGTVHTNGLTANGVTISMTTYDWGDGTDGLWIVDLQ